jgi:hypothetical protein
MPIPDPQVFKWPEIEENSQSNRLGYGPVYMEARLARLARQPGKRDLAV